MKNLVLIKFGGSVITDKSVPYTARPAVIRKLVKKVKSFKNKSTDVIVGHGGGSFPHIPAVKYQIQKGIINKNSIKGFCETADSAIKINRIVIGEFLSLGEHAVSFAPLSFIYDGKIIFEHIKKCLEIGVIPVIYGDVIMNKRQGFEIYSGEKTLDLLAHKLSKFYRSVRVIYFTDTSGVYDSEGKTISSITPRNFLEIKKHLWKSGNIDITGGMVHKVEEGLSLAKRINAKVYIMNGLNKGRYTKILKN